MAIYEKYPSNTKAWSQRQRRAFIVENVKMPKHLIRMVVMNDTPLKRELNSLTHYMVRGKIPIDIPRLQDLIDKIDAARWATPKPDPLKEAVNGQTS